MRLVGMNPVVVHGGGPQITDLMRRLGKEPEFVDGLRVTDAETVDIVRMALVGKVNREIVAVAEPPRLRTRSGSRGEDAGLITVDQRDPALGFVGDVRRIDPSILERLIREELIPIVATVGVDDDGQAYNVNADTVAGAIARRSAPRSSCTSPTSPGVYGDFGDESSLISRHRRRRARAAPRRRQDLGGHDPEAASCVAGAEAAACAAPTSSTAACRTRCCSSSSPARASARWCAHDAADDEAAHRATPGVFPPQREARRPMHVGCRRTAGCPSRSCAARARASGTATAASTSTSSAASRSRRSATRTRRSPTRSPSRRARCCTSRTSTTTSMQPQLAGAPRRAARGRRPGVLRQLRRRGERVRDQARPPATARATAVPSASTCSRAYGSFHGRTLTTLAATGQPQKQETFQPLPSGFRQVAFADLDALAAALDERVCRGPARGGAGRGRRATRAAGYLEAVRAAVRRARGAAHHRRGADRSRPHRALVRLRARRGVRPDVVTMAKALGNGVPIGACWARADVAAVVPARRPRDDVRRPAARGRGRARRARRHGSARTCRRGADAAGERLTEALQAVRGVADVRGPGLLVAAELDAGARRPSRSSRPLPRRGPGRERGDADARCASRRRCSSPTPRSTRPSRSSSRTAACSTEWGSAMSRRLPRGRRPHARPRSPRSSTGRSRGRPTRRRCRRCSRAAVSPCCSRSRRPAPGRPPRWRS